MPREDQSPDMSFGEKTLEAGLRLYDRMANRKDMPTNRRIYLESVLDRSKEPITETAFTPAELGTLSEIILNKYKPLEPALNEYEKYLSERLNSHKKAVTEKNKDQMLYPDFLNRYANDLEAIQAYKQGKITPTFLELASGTKDYPRAAALGRLNLREKFNVKPIVGYEDYGIEQRQARRALSGADPREALHTTLGRFRYEIDPETNSLVVVDKYDFNPTMSAITGKTATTQPIGTEQLVTSPVEGFDNGIYGMLRQYAGRVLPEGQGRNVRVRLNSLSPPVLNALVKD